MRRPKRGRHSGIPSLIMILFALSSSVASVLTNQPFSIHVAPGIFFSINLFLFTSV